MRTCNPLRSIVALAVVLVGGFSNVAEAWCEDAGKTAGQGDLLTTLAPMQTIAASDDQLTRARKERYNAALAQLISQQELFKVGAATLGSALEPLDRLARAGKPVLKRDEYLRLLTECVKVAKGLEAAAKVRSEGGFGTTGSFHEATFMRADLEVRLLEAQEADKK